jgi:hypothetical protein
MPRILSGPVHEFALMGHVRRYSKVTMPLVEALNFFEPVPYDAHTGLGEQRVAKPAQVKSLRLAMRKGEFTPTDWAANVPPELQGRVDRDGGLFSLELPDGKTLPLTDGGQRRSALLGLIEEQEDRLANSTSPADQEEAGAILDELSALPITTTVYLDGTPQLDFLNLQKGERVERTLILALELETEQIEDNSYFLARTVASLLLKDHASPFYGQIKMDAKSRGLIPLSTLFAAGSSDQGVSLIGLARVGALFNLNEKRLAALFPVIRNVLRERCDGIINAGFPLTLPERGGTKGSATMLVGLAVCLAYRMGVEKQLTPPPALLADLAWAADKTLYEPIQKTFSAATKRQYLGRFAREFFKDQGVEMHEGVPLGLCEVLSATSFGLSPLKRRKQEPVGVAP